MRVKKFKLWGTLYAMAGGRDFTMVSNAGILLEETAYTKEVPQL
jgi:hypothetical protein